MCETRPCGCGSSEPGPHVDEGLLLAEVDVQVKWDGRRWVLPDVKSVQLDERRRPFLINLGLLQEMLLCGPCCGEGPTVPVAAGTVIAAGRFDRAGKPVFSANGLTARPLAVPSGALVYLLTFPSYDDSRFNYVVTGATTATSPSAAHSFEVIQLPDAALAGVTSSSGVAIRVAINNDALVTGFTAQFCAFSKS